MIKKGKILKSDSGRRYRIGDFIQAGGQGEAYFATDVKSKEKGVIKKIHKRFSNTDSVNRLRFLIKQNLRSICPAFCPPTDLFSNTSKMVGHYSPLAPGLPLGTLLESPSFNLVEAIQLGITMSHAFSILHDRNFVHGDIQCGNFLVEREGSVLKLHIIDLDNFVAQGAPAPPCVGQEMYMSPELRENIAHSRPAIPSIASERFALAVQLHEIILLLHPASGADESPEDFQRAMCKNRWLQDPAAHDKPTGDLGGYPAEILNTNLARLMRSAFSLDPAERPSAKEWELELAKALSSIYSCPRKNCNGPSIIDIGKDICPFCELPYPSLTIQMLDGKRIPLSEGTVVVGRADLGGSMMVSERHAIFRRIGPETCIESLGGNGTYRHNGSTWIRIPDRKQIPLQENDKLRLANVEVIVA